MPIKLKPGEIAFYPQPFVESEPNLLVISNQRVIQFGDDGLQEMAVRDVSHLGRLSKRPFLTLCIVAIVLGLPLVGTGLYLFLSVKAPLPAIPAAPAIPGAPAVPAPAAAAAKALAEDDPSGGTAEEGEGSASDSAGSSSLSMDPLVQRGLGLGLGLLGLGFLAGAFFGIRVVRHFVIIRGGQQVMNIRLDDQIRQTQILMTVQATMQGQKSGAPAPAQPAKPKVEVDDKGDPVKALQDLALARQTGKVSEDEFQAKREVLLERLKSRRG